MSTPSLETNISQSELAICSKWEQSIGKIVDFRRPGFVDRDWEIGSIKRVDKEGKPYVVVEDEFREEVRIPIRESLRDIIIRD